MAKRSFLLVVVCFVGRRVCSSTKYVFMQAASTIVDSEVCVLLSCVYLAWQLARISRSNVLGETELVNDSDSPYFFF